MFVRAKITQGAGLEDQTCDWSAHLVGRRLQRLMNVIVGWGRCEQAVCVCVCVGPQDPYMSKCDCFVEIYPVREVEGAYYRMPHR